MGDLRWLDLGALRRWLNQHTEIDNVPCEVSLIAGGRSNPTYEIICEARSWILRRPPLGLVLPTAHDMRREYRVMNALGSTSVPVPHTVGLCTDRDVIGCDFYVMDKLDGITLRSPDDTAHLSRSQRSVLADSMIEILAALHEVEPESVGLGDWGRPQGFLNRQLERWGKQWAASATRPNAEVVQLIEALRRTMPTRTYSGIVHGDFKIDNLMVDRNDPSQIIGVLDWEMSTLGDTMTDVGLLASFWDQEGELFNPITAGATAMPGFPSRAEIVQKYADRRSVAIDNIDWYMAFADLKIAVILEGIHARYQRGQTVGEGFETIGDMVAPLLARAVDACRQAPR